MITDYECIPCAINGLLNLFNQNLIDIKYKDKIMKELLKYYAELDFNNSPLLVNRNIHRMIRKISGNPDPYKTLKDKYNEKALKLYPEYSQIVNTSNDKFDKALRLAVAGNVIDFGPGHKIDINKSIDEIFNSKLSIDHSIVLFDEIKRAKNILYTADNTGEIVFDRIFLETINHPNVTIAVKRSPILNDATHEDAKIVGLDKLAKIIDNGDDAPGTLLISVSDEFMQAYNSADLIISKGQGNYEGLNKCGNKNIFFLLVAKCDIIAKDLGVNKGGFIVKSSI
ncbi:MAG: ARMT1-like domain-containing protein [Candidatus Gastranaerophilales bacterium]|nr:ARMT1-like domain-containing protein [Candidatus Gastranaerophilales bacterium]